MNVHYIHCAEGVPSEGASVGVGDFREWRHCHTQYSRKHTMPAIPPPTKWINRPTPTAAPKVTTLSNFGRNRTYPTHSGVLPREHNVAAVVEHDSAVECMQEYETENRCLSVIES
jgi:hypothetical protein